MGFKNIVFYNEEEKIFCYRTGMSVYEESFRDGRLSARGWNAAGYMQNVLDSFPQRLDTRRFTQPQAFSFEANGYSMENGWAFERFDTREQTLENGAEVLRAALVLQHTQQPLELTVRTELDGTGMLSRALTIKNTADTPMALSHIAPLCGGLERTENWRSRLSEAPLYEVGYMTDHRWAHEGQFCWNALADSVFSVCGRYRFDRFRHPVVFLRNNATGVVFFSQLAWSAGYAFDFSLDSASDDAALSLCVRLDGPSPWIVLEPGEEITTPAVHIGVRFGSLDDAVQEMHEHLRTSVFTFPEARGVTGWIEGGMGPERVMDFEAVRHFADTAAAVGAGTLILDAGWFCRAGREGEDWAAHTGDWTADAEKYPDQFRQVRDYIHAKGLLFGLWADIESVGHSSKLYDEHPDWTLCGTNTLDMTRPEVAEWVENALIHILEDYQADVFRLDNNADFRSFFHTVGEGVHRQAAVSRYYKAVYAMYSRLRRRFPDVVFENCAGGGGRTDLGLTTLFSHTWVSDWQIAPRGIAVTNGMTMALPPERVDRLIGGMGGHAFGALDLQVRHALFGRPTVNDFNAVGTPWNPQQIEFVRHSLDIYREYVQAFGVHTRVFHHTPEICGEHPTGTCILERTAESGECGILGVFRLGGKPDTEHVTVYPRGVDVSAQYLLTMDNSGSTVRVSGYSLHNEGVRVQLAGTLTSELLAYKKISG